MWRQRKWEKMRELGGIHRGMLLVRRTSHTVSPCRYGIKRKEGVPTR